ncbi:MAG TPA: ester cyclase [Thermoanaerobaculia bacterium]|nr:ester cyclase [Thermoanaerobaculia bacterium]
MRRSLALAGLLLLLALPGRAQTQPPVPEPPPAPAAPATPAFDANKDLARRYIEEVLAGGDLKALDTLLAPDYVDSSPGAEAGRGPEVVRVAQERVRALFRDLHYHIDQLVAEGDKVVARYTVRAVRKRDEGGGVGDAGKEIGIVGMTIFRVADGRIRETWTINDQFTMFRQLGYTLTPPAPKASQKPGAPPAKPPGG